MHSMHVIHERVQMHPWGASLTKQAFKKECDINQIMKQYKKSGLLDHVNTHQGNYGDFLNFEDYHSSLNKIIEAKDAFYSIPSEIRAKFDNDPSLFMEFAQNDENHEALVELGLAFSKKAVAQEEGARAPEPPLPTKEPGKALKGDTEPEKSAD